MPPSNRRRRAVEDDDSDSDRRTRQRPNEQDSEEEEEDAQDSEYGEGMDTEEQAGSNADDQLAKKLVRYAISCEYSRTPIRRDGIKERVLGNQGRSFKKVFEMAQKHLRHVWGMELRELPVREKMSLQEKRQAMKSNAQPKVGSGAYILSSTLPEAYRSAAILSPSKIPSADEEATYAAFYTLVVSLIYLNGGELTEQKLRRHLLRLNADQNVSSEKTETTFKRMEKHGYVVRKVERPPLGQEGNQVTSWLVGPRAKEEVGLDGVMGVVKTVYGGSDSDLETKLRASLGIKARPEAQGDDNEGEAS